MAKYGNKQIARELMMTAQGEAYFGNALRVAKDIPCVTQEERAVLDRWLAGSDEDQASLRFDLQDISIKIHNYKKHGGKRKGSGRHKMDPVLKRVQLSLTLPKWKKEWIDKQKGSHSDTLEAGLDMLMEKREGSDVL